jgi:DNA-binding NarL/FixJ family response regulator
VCQVYSTILLIGAKDKAKGLTELPLRLLMINTGKEAIQCLREERVDSVVSRWELVDMPDGLLLERILAARPKMPTVAFVEPGNQQQEIMARSLGVTAILSDDIDDDYFRETLCQILHIEDISVLSLAGVS